MAEKGGYRHFMLKEIHEQPRAILDTLAGRMRPESGEVFFENVAASRRTARIHEEGDPRRLRHILACGPRRKFMIEGLARIPVEVDLGSEYRLPRSRWWRRGRCASHLPVRRDGGHPRGMREAKAKGATTISICNVVASTIARESDASFTPTPARRSGWPPRRRSPPKLVALYLMAIHLARARRFMTRHEMSLHLFDLSELPRKIEEFLKREPEIAAVARKYKDARDFLFLGRGISYPIALEGR